MALLTQFDPIVNLHSLNSWLEKELPEFHSFASTSTKEPWRPAVDILEDVDTFIIEIEIPGIAETAIDMKIEKQVLTLTGARETDEQNPARKTIRRERAQGHFVRSFHLPDTVGTETVTAKLTQGVLRIELPKKEETKPRTIKVEMK
jgi:HSP20 family protein